MQGHTIDTLVQFGDFWAEDKSFCLALLFNLQISLLSILSAQSSSAAIERSPDAKNTGRSLFVLQFSCVL
jgi:hypothetical protein